MIPVQQYIHQPYVQYRYVFINVRTYRVKNILDFYDWLMPTVEDPP